MHRQFLQLDFDFVVRIPIGDSVAYAQIDFIVRPSREGGTVMLVDSFKNWTTRIKRDAYCFKYDSVSIANPNST